MDLVFPGIPLNLLQELVVFPFSPEVFSLPGLRCHSRAVIIINGLTPALKVMAQLNIETIKFANLMGLENQFDGKSLFRVAQKDSSRMTQFSKRQTSEKASRDRAGILLNKSENQ